MTNPCQIEACAGQPVCSECQRLRYCPGAAPGGAHNDLASELRDGSAPVLSASELTAALLQIKDCLPKSTRMQTTGSIVVLTLGAQIPSKSDAAAATGFIRAMVATGEKRSSAKETGEIRYSSDQRQ